MTENINDLNKETRDAWEVNAEVWDARMSDEVNDFFNILCWPALVSLLDPKPDSRIPDIACGNGLTTCRRAVILTGGIFFTLSLALTGISYSFLFFLASYILFHPSSGAFVSLSQASLMDLQPERRKQNMQWIPRRSLKKVMRIDLLN